MPSFVHVGPPRTGTTWLHEVMLGHVGLPSEKETRFFDVRYDRGAQWYCGLFGEYSPDVPGGEMGPTYFSNAISRERIKHDIPDCKIIVTFREPAARLYSLYRLLRSERRPVNDTFDGYWRFQINCGADLCSYATHLKRWQATFGKSHVLVLFYEDLSSNPQAYLDSVCDFVGARRIALDRSAGRQCESVFGARRRPLQRHCAAHGRGYRLGFPSRRAAVDPDRPAHARCGRSCGGRSSRIFRRSVYESADEIRAMMLPETEELERSPGETFRLETRRTSQTRLRTRTFRSAAR